jgi:Ca2+/Na+ antiporter
MGILFKLIIILGLVFLIAGLFTKSKAERVARRNRTTNILLVVLIAMLAVTTIMGFINR